MFLTSPLKVCGEVELRIHQNLMGAHEVDSRDDPARLRASAVARAVPRLARGAPAERRDACRSAATRKARAARATRTARRRIASEAAAEVYGLNMLVPRDRGPAGQHDALPGRRPQALPAERRRQDHAAGLGERTPTRPGALLRLLGPLATPRHQHDAHRVAAVAPAQVGLRVLRRPRRPRGRTRSVTTALAEVKAQSDAVQGARRVPEGGRSEPSAPVMPHPHSYRAPADGIAGDDHGPGDKSISHRAVMLGAIADGHDPRARIPRGRGLPRDAARRSRRSACRSTGTRCSPCRVDGVGLRGLQRAARRCSTWATPARDAAFMGLLAAQAFDSVLVGDESLHAAADGAGRRRRCGRWARGSRRPTASRRCACSAARSLSGIGYELPVASAQVKSAVLLAGLYARRDARRSSPGPQSPRPHRAHAAEHSGVQVERDASGARSHGVARRRRDAARPRDRRARATSRRPRSSSSRPASARADGSLIKNVGVNPTRTGLLEMLRADGRRHASSSQPAHARRGAGRGHLFVRQSELRGVACPRTLVPLAIDEFPILFVAAACADGETLVTRRGGAARQGERPASRSMARGLAARRASRSRCCRTACASTAAGSAAARSTAAATTGSRCRSRSRACSRAAPIEILDVANVATSFPGFSSVATDVGLGVGPGAGTAPDGAMAVPVIAIDGPSGSGKGTIAAARGARLGWHLLDSGALYRLVALAGGAPRQSRRSPRHARAASRARWTSASSSVARRRAGAARRRATSPRRCGPRRRARRPPGSPPCPRSARPCWSASGPLPAAGPGGGRPGHGHRGFPGRRAQGLPDGERRRTRAEAP